MDENDRQLKMMQRRLREEGSASSAARREGAPRMCRTQPARPAPHTPLLPLLPPLNHLLPRPQVDESAIDSQLAEGGRRQLDGGGGRPVGARAGGRPGGAGGGMPRGGGMEADPNVTGG